MTLYALAPILLLSSPHSLHTLNGWLLPVCVSVSFKKQGHASTCPSPTSPRLLLFLPLSLLLEWRFVIDEEDPRAAVAVAGVAGINCGWERESPVVGSGYVAVGAVSVVGSAVVVVEEEVEAEGEGFVGSAVAVVTAVEVRSHLVKGDTQVSIGR